MSMSIEYTTKDQWTTYINNLGETVNLELSGLGLTDSNIVGLAEALKNDTRVTRLDLKNNKITSVGAKALAEALLENKKIATNRLWDTGVILLDENQLGKDGVLAIFKVLHQSKRAAWTTSVADNGLTEGDLVEIAEAPEVQKLTAEQEQFRRGYNGGDCIIS